MPRYVAALFERMLMLYVIHALDKPGRTQTRLDNYADHKSYISSASIKTLVSGPLLDDDRETMIGSFFLVEADSKEDVISSMRPTRSPEFGCGKVSASMPCIDRGHS